MDHRQRQATTQHHPAARRLLHRRPRNRLRPNQRTHPCSNDTAAGWSQRRQGLTMINAWKILRLAIRINRETKNGMAIITCPQWQHAEVKAHIWAKNVERAAEKRAQYD